jgi:hypothetical protein
MAYNPIDWDALERRLVVPVKRPFFVWRRVGGLRHWRIGRLGGSFYLAKPAAFQPLYGAAYKRNNGNA